MMARPSFLVSLLLPMLLCGCQPRSTAEEIEIARFPLDNLDDLLTTSGVDLDSEVSHDGSGSLRIEAEEPLVVRLFEVGDVDVENARLLYRAHLRSTDLEGRAYLEMWCVFEGRGEYFSRGLDNPLTGTIEWTRRQIPFFLKAGENPDRLLLNLVVDGRGTVWIDDIVVTRGAL